MTTAKTLARYVQEYRDKEEEALTAGMLYLDTFNDQMIDAAKHGKTTYEIEVSTYMINKVTMAAEFLGFKTNVKASLFKDKRILMLNWSDIK